MVKIRRNKANASSSGPDDERKADSMHVAMKRIKEEINAVQNIQQRHKPRYHYHGFVWLFLRTGSE